MRPLVVTVGPLASSSANNIATSQKAAGATTHQLVLDGAATDKAATAVCASQTPSGAGALTINGTAANNGVAYFGQMRRVYVTSAGNDSGVTFTITGTGIAGTGAIGTGGGVGVSTAGARAIGGTYFGITETVTGANVSEVSTNSLFYSVTSVTISGAAAGAVTVGMVGLATLDVARQVLITSAGNDSSITFTIAGTDWAGLPISEVVAGPNATTAASLLSYKTVNSVLTSAAVASTVQVGTNGVASSPWVAFDPLAAMPPIGIQVSGSGTVNWTVQSSMDDPNSPTNPIAPASVVWVNHADPALVSSAIITGVQGKWDTMPLWARIVLNSGSGSIRGTFLQPFVRS